MKLIVGIGVTITLAALSAPAGAHHSADLALCNNLLVAVPPEPAPSQFYYVEDHEPLAWGEGQVFSVWIYQESNGVPGLQRHDDACSTPGFDDPVGPPADTIIF